MSTVLNATISDNWTNLNILLDIVDGTSLTIQNQPVSGFYIQESE